MESATDAGQQNISNVLENLILAVISGTSSDRSSCKGITDHYVIVALKICPVFIFTFLNPQKFSDRWLLR